MQILQLIQVGNSKTRVNKNDMCFSSGEQKDIIPFICIVERIDDITTNSLSMM